MANHLINKRTIMRNQILEIIINAVDNLNSTLESKLPVEQAESCPIYNNGIALDSISLVTLIVHVEQAIEDQLNSPIILANEKAMSRKNSPFLTIGTLTDYTLELVKDGEND